MNPPNQIKLIRLSEFSWEEDRLDYGAPLLGDETGGALLTYPRNGTALQDTIVAAAPPAIDGGKLLRTTSIGDVASSPLNMDDYGHVHVGMEVTLANAGATDCLLRLQWSGDGDNYFEDPQNPVSIDATTTGYKPDEFLFSERRAKFVRFVIKPNDAGAIDWNFHYNLV